MLPADRRDVEHDLAAGMPADEDFPRLQREPFAVEGTGLEFERGHERGQAEVRANLREPVERQPELPVRGTSGTLGGLATP